MKEYQIIRRHILRGLEGGAWGGFIFSLHLFFQYGSLYLQSYLVLTFWSVIIGSIIGVIIGVLNTKRSTELGPVERAMIGGCCILLLAALSWLTSTDNGAVTPPTWPQAIFNVAETVALLGVLPGVMAGLE